MFDQMKTFVRIAEMGSITRAARSLGMSLPMASRHLRWLEQELGTALVHRTTRQLHLTGAGEEFAARARALLLGLDEAKQALRPGPSLVGGVVVSAPSALGTYQLSPILPSLATKHPDLRVELRLEDRAVDLVKEGVDLAIRAGAPPDRASLVARELVTYDRVLYAAPSFLARHGAIDTLAALAAAPCILHAQHGVIDSPAHPAASPCVNGSGPATWDFETPEGRKSITVDGPLRTNNVAIIRDAVVAGIGVAWLPSYLDGEELRDGRLVRLLPEAKLPPIRVHGIMLKQARQSATVRAVLDVLGAALRAQAAKLAG
jgi:DNA-binding transcriptional LysR family regulator